jgi:hypothetical protein
MNRLRYLLYVICLILPASVRAQDTLKTRVSYDLSTETAVGTGDYTAFLLAANRHHVLGTRSHTAYLRGALNMEHQLNKDFLLSAVVDGIASVEADHKLYLQQCYLSLSTKTFSIEVGCREEKPVMRDEYLSSGSFVKGTNAKPIPQVQFTTNGFRTVKNTKDWLQVNFGAGYGKFMDSDYHEELFQKIGSGNNRYSTDVYYHQKHLYFRSNPTKPFFGVVGIEHAVQFGGTYHVYSNGVLTTKEKPVNVKAFWNVILPIGDSNYFENDAIEDWVYGNHVGMMTYQVGWNISKHHMLQAYLDNPFEDGSGIRKGNGWDGLWGLQYTNKTPGRQYVRGAVFEFLQTTNQSGPLHWDSGDYPEQIRYQIHDYVTGNDDYYNHYFYDGYSYYGMTPGNPLIISPIYNRNGSLLFPDNRVKAWYMGINGEITDNLSYLVKDFYREGWGTYNYPLPKKHYSFSALFQGTYRLGPWQFCASYAFDRGNNYGDCSSFSIRIGYHGKLL